MSRAIFPFLFITMAFCAISADDGSEKQTKRYITANELLKAAEPLFQPVRPKEADPDEKRLWLVEYLGVKDPEVRSAAIMTLLRLLDNNHRIRASAFMPYLSKENSIDVQVVALAYSLQGAGIQRDESREQIRGVWKNTLERLAGEAVCPPHLEAVAVSFSYTDTDAKFCANALKKDYQMVIMKRFLAILGRTTETKRSQILASVWSFPHELLVPELTAWYQVEPDAKVRRNVIIYSTRAGREEWKLFRVLFELASKDSDSETMEIARQHMQDFDR